MTDLLDKRLLFVTGKGGVGKTTVSAALGLAAARRGARALVAEVSQQERISRALRPDQERGIGFDETELAPGLWAISIDPELALREYLEDQIGSRTLTSLLSRSRIFQYFAAAAPGMKELVTMGKVWELSQLERRKARSSPYDVVIVDAPATGHGLGMLSAPRTFRDVARVGPVRRRADLIHSQIVDRAQTAVVAVALPEEMPVNETVDFARLLGEEMELDLDAVIVNGLLPGRFTGAEAERIADAEESADGAAGAALHAATSEHLRARVQRSQLGRLRRAKLAPVMTLPYLFEPELGYRELDQLAEELEGKL